MSLPTPEMYRELRLMARSIMRGERKGHTLSSTDLFHEAYSRLQPLLESSQGDVGEFRALFVLTMRRVLVEHARKRSRRSLRLTRIAISENEFGQLSKEPSDLDRAEDYAELLLQLDLAVERLKVKYPVHAQVVELKYFGGLTVLQCAEHLGLGSATVQRYWNFARAWIGREMEIIDPFR
ncbi:MAG: sigma-70 family RNA polymerase sigma factor [Pirellula sp.]